VLTPRGLRNQVINLQNIATDANMTTTAQEDQRIWWEPSGENGSAEFAAQTKCGYIELLHRPGLCGVSKAEGSLDDVALEEWFGKVLQPMITDRDSSQVDAYMSSGPHHTDYGNWRGNASKEPWQQVENAVSSCVPIY
jgi:hypothetical protein